MDEHERAKREIIETAKKLELGVDRQLEQTEWEDAETLQNWNESYGEQAQTAQQVGQAQYRQALRNIKRDPVLLSTLKKRGLSPEKFVEMQAQNPQAYQQAYSSGIEDYLDILEGKSAKPKSDPFFEAGSRKASPDRVAKAKAIAAKGRGDDQMMDDILGALLFDE